MASFLTLSVLGRGVVVVQLFFAENAKSRQKMAKNGAENPKTAIRSNRLGRSKTHHLQISGQNSVPAGFLLDEKVSETQDSCRMCFSEKAVEKRRNKVKFEVLEHVHAFPQTSSGVEPPKLREVKDDIFWQLFRPRN